MHMHAFIVQCLYVDPINELLVATMLDKNACVWDLDDPMPRMTCKGHGDLIRAVGYLKETRCFVTGSWDKCVSMVERGSRTSALNVIDMHSLVGVSLAYCHCFASCRTLRLWNCPGSQTHLSTSSGQIGRVREPNLLDDDQGEEDHFVSSYEKAHPLKEPESMRGKKNDEWAILKAIGAVEDDKAGKRRGKALKEGLTGAGGTWADVPTDAPGTLGSKLESMGRDLLTVSSLVMDMPACMLSH